jgi:ribosomal 50S subunit-recycling heat shock protein
MRLDKFLKVSRLIKRRTVSKEACDASRIMVNEKAAKPSHDIKEGDIITIGYGDKSFSVRVLSVKETVKKDEVQSMYEAVK